MKHTLLKNTLFKYKLNLYIADTNKEYSAISKKLRDKGIDVLEDVSGTEAYFTHKGLDRYIVMNGYSVQTFVHEATHATFHMLEDRGVPIRYENDEVFAYSLEYFVSEYMKLHYKRLGIIKK